MRKKGWGNILLFFFAAFRYFWAPVGAWPALGSKLDAGVAALFSSSSSSSSSSFLVLVLVFFFRSYDVDVDGVARVADTRHPPE